MKTRMLCLLMMVLGLVVASPVWAVKRFTPVSVVASSTYTSVGALPEAMIDGTGFDYYGDSTDTHDSGELGWPSHWLSDNEYPNAWLIFDLGEVVDVGGIQLWNCNYDVDSRFLHGIERMDVWLSSDPAAASDSGHASWARVLDDQTVAIGTGSHEDYSETFSWTVADARYIKLDNMISPGGSYISLAEVRFNGDVKPAWEPSPRDHFAQNVSAGATLSWSAGDDAISHKVYLGTGLYAVADADEFSAEYKGLVGVTSYDPDPNLAYDTTYYWRVDEVGASETHRGDIWTFKTREYFGPEQKMLAFMNSTLDEDVYIAFNFQTRVTINDPWVPYIPTWTYQPFKTRVNTLWQQVYWRKDAIAYDFYGELFTYDDDVIMLHVAAVTPDSGDLCTQSGNPDWSPGRTLAPLDGSESWSYAGDMDVKNFYSYDDLNCKIFEPYAYNVHDDVDIIREMPYSTVHDGEPVGYPVADEDFKTFDEALIIDQKIWSNNYRERFIFAREGEDYYGLVRWDGSWYSNGQWDVLWRSAGMRLLQYTDFSFDGFYDRSVKDNWVAHEAATTKAPVEDAYCVDVNADLSWWPGAGGIRLNPVSVWASSTYPGIGADADSLIDGTGLDYYTATDSHDAGELGFSSVWLSDVGDYETASLIFDLGDVTRLEHIQVWNNNDRFITAAYIYGADSMDVWLSSDPAAASDPDHASWVRVLDDQPVRLGAGGEHDYSERFHWGQATPARYIKIDDMSSSPLAGDFVSLAEVRFRGVVSHNVYFGTDPCSLELVSEGQSDTTYDPGLLDPDTTYYWRVDETSIGCSTRTGTVSRFTTTRGLDVTLSCSSGVMVEGDCGSGSVLVSATIQENSQDVSGFITIEENGEIHGIIPTASITGGISIVTLEIVVSDTVCECSVSGVSNAFDISGMISGDLDCNSDVNLIDFAKFAAEWQEDDSSKDLLGDLDGDGIVDLVDLSIFAGNWLY